MLTFTVKNFGPLAEGTVELRPLTVFVGGSNTGKSYMASAIYAAAMAAGPFVRLGVPTDFTFARGGNPRGLFTFGGGLTREEDDKEAVQSIWEWVRQQTQQKLVVSRVDLTTLPEDARAWLKKIVLRQLAFFYIDTIDQLRQLHGEKSKFLRQGGEPGDFQLSIHNDAPLLRLKIHLSDNAKSLSEPEFDMLQTVLVGSDVEWRNVLNIGEDEWSKGMVADRLVNLTIQSVFSGMSAQSWYLPAARSGIVQGHKVLAASLARQSRRVGLEPINIPSLPGVTTQFLGDLIELDKRMAGRPGFTRQLGAAIDFIETSVIRGKVDLDESSGLPTSEIVYLPEIDGAVAGKFTLEHTSSMVSELAPLVLFLKYLVNPGDLLVLEEPESHLHPAAQRELARGIVRLVNAGVKVLVTTHSDTFVSQLNNLLRISYASKRWLREKGFAPEECLNPDDLSVYMFALRDGGDGTEAKKVEISPDFGIDDEWFDEVVKALYDETVLVQRVRVS